MLKTRDTIVISRQVLSCVRVTKEIVCGDCQRMHITDETFVSLQRIAYNYYYILLVIRELRSVPERLITRIA